MREVLLFVYGSLKRGCSNHAELEGARLVATCSTAPAYGLTTSAGYPAMIPGAAAVPGELYAVSEELLLRLDAFEGADYRREQVELEDGRTALAYVLSHR
jgi:gamma-glutamylaminecyclotransferase